MSRTIKEIRITGKTPEEVKLCAGDWFHSNGFNIREWDSKGRPFNARAMFSIIGAIIRPHKGAMVAVQIDMTGCIVFEISFRLEGNDTILHGEFYAAGGELFALLESDLKPKSSMLGKYPRESGYKLMWEFLQAMKNC